MKKPVERVPYAGELAPYFFAIADKVYAPQPFRPAEKPAAVQALFRLEAARNEIILYTNYEDLRLVGIFPADGSDAYFGWWETVEDIGLNQAAFALLRADAAQRGRPALVGPINFNTYHDYRLRLGPAPSWGLFDREPAHPDYYPPLLARLGFVPRSTFESRLIRRETVPVVYAHKADALAELRKLPFEFIPLNEASWQQHEAEIFALVQLIFGANPNYRPISLAQFRLLYNADYARKLCPHTSVLFRSRESGGLVALSFCHPNYQPLHLPAGTAPDFARDYPRLPRKVLLAKTVGVHPDFRQRGLMDLLGAYGMVHFREYYEEVLFCLMRSDNFSLHFTDGLPMETARYALFEHRW
ncbi:hypothetical protein [Hymenobacter algoricola]|uniref:GNAT family N-acetyltransferase n=1 Tax=Hymenobacter algoricola TaxID=486267 RepID=A0ABP7MZ55_9BACT